jgi:hypothetical protein
MYPFEETGGTELHLDGFVLDPTIEIDGDPVVEDGELTFLDDPDIREVAAEHGDPDKLLTQK